MCLQNRADKHPNDSPNAPSLRAPKGKKGIYPQPRFRIQIAKSQMWHGYLYAIQPKILSLEIRSVINSFVKFNRNE